MGSHAPPPMDTHVLAHVLAHRSPSEPTHGHPCLYSWVPMATHGNPWVKTWVPVRAHGSPWPLSQGWVPVSKGMMMSAHGSPGVPMGAHGLPWEPDPKTKLFENATEQHSMDLMRVHVWTWVAMSFLPWAPMGKGIFLTPLISAGHLGPRAATRGLVGYYLSTSFTITPRCNNPCTRTPLN